MNKKLIFVTIILFIIFFIFGSYLVISESDLSSKIKKLIPNNIKLILKETIFIIPKLKKENEQINEKLKILSKEIQILKIGNENLLGFKIIQDPLDKKLDNKKFLLTKFFLTGNPHNFVGYQETELYKGRYIEKFDDKLIFLDSFKFYNTSINENIFDIEKLDITELDTNLKIFKNIAGIRDMKVINDEVYLYSIFKNLDCYYAKILKSELKFNKLKGKFDTLEFNDFINFDFCGRNAMQSGGRIEEYKDNHIIVSNGDYGTLKWDGIEENFFSNENPLGKIISINISTKEKIILSKGHRNPQGLVYHIKNDVIINTEHGPKGGDEINVNLLDYTYNFGWPIASYGIKYDGSDPFQKTHKNFDEPVKYYNPSIAPSQIIQKYSEDTFLFATLKDKSLHEIKFSNDFTKVVEEKRYYIGERIRDIVHVQNDIYALLLDNSPSLAFLKLNN